MPPSQAQHSIRSLCQAQALSSPVELYRWHMAALLDALSHSQPSWTRHSTQRLQLEVITMQSGERGPGGRVRVDPADLSWLYDPISPPQLTSHHAVA